VVRMPFRVASIVSAMPLVLSVVLHAQLVDPSRGSSGPPKYDFSGYKYYGTWFYPEEYDPNVGLRVMVSNDALKWTDIASSYVTDNPTGRVGNALVMFSDNKFHLYTCGGPAQTIQIASSVDGHTYTSELLYHAEGKGDFASDGTQTWAGTWFTDREGHIHILWSSSSGLIYEIQAVNDHDLSEGFSDPVRLTGTGLTRGIDPFIYDDGAAYYLFYQAFQNGNPDDNFITVLKSSSGPFSGYNVVVKHGDWAGLGARSDQPIMYFGITENVWSLYDDDWGSSGMRRVQLESGDWRLGTDKWGHVQTLSGRPPKIRSGSFIRVPK
jgi:hypothetical protein